MEKFKVENGTVQETLIMPVVLWILNGCRK